jgi:SPOR domain
MSDDERTQTMPVFDAPLPAADVKRCPACLSPVRNDQRYCLECGERLLADEIPPPPGGSSGLSERGTTLLVVAAIVLIVLGIGLAWVGLRDTSDSQPTTETTPPPTATTGTVPTDTMPTDTMPTDTMPTDTMPTDTMPTDTSAAGGWPAGQTGWAVILASKSQSQFQQSDAQAIADEATAAGVQQVGVLDSSQFPSLNPGYWAVFSGPYATKDEAQAAATTIQGQGYPEAYPREVQP